MMATAIGQAQSCGFQVYYWAHDIHLWDGTLPFSLYASSIAPYATATKNLAQGGTLAASSAVQGYPAANANDNDLSTYWQAADSTATLTLHLSPGRPRQPRHPGTPRELGHPQPDHRGRRQRQRHHLDHPRARRRLHLHRRQQRHRHPGPGRHPGLPPPRHQRQHRQGAPQIAEFQAYDN